MHYYVIADPSDNSVTLSKKLFAHIRSNAKPGDEARVFVFRLTGSSQFAFCVNPELTHSTQMCDIQYNDRYRCIGFETLCPSVGLILYEYGLPCDNKIKLSVSVYRTSQGIIYYQFDKPHAKYIRKHKKG